MSCPRCATPAPPGQVACVRCGFGLPALMAAFGLNRIEMHRLCDDAHALRVHELREVEAVLIEFEEQFPQLFFSVYLGVLPSPLSVGEVAFLMLNRGWFWAEHHPRLNEHALALVLDPESRNAALMVGYALEELLPPPVLARILRRVRTPLWHSEYAPAMVAVVRQVARVLRRRTTRARRSDVLPPSATEDFLSGSTFLGPQATARNAAGAFDPDPPGNPR